MRDVDALKALLIEMPQQRSVDALLQTIVTRLAAMPAVALARVWLVSPGDICAECARLPDCRDQSACFQLAASAGRSVTQPSVTWSRLDGQYRRLPLDVAQFGRHVITRTTRWVDHPDWVEREGICGYGAERLEHAGELLGELVVFSREEMTAEALTWMRMIADHAAGAIVNARAFEEIERLRNQLALENAYLREEVKAGVEFGSLLGRSHSLAKVVEQITLVAASDATVLVLGESGTGKELVAREIHERSGRRGRPMIKVNCASVPAELFESEFFGHVKGAFTGALRDRVGRFELADGGTLFLDEVGEIPIELQGKLLRVLQEGTFERVGEERSRRADVRIVAATNRDLKHEVDEKRFRLDLYYRLSVFPIELAPLRDRREDIAPLAAHFLDQACRRLGRERMSLKHSHVRALEAYGWPGNIRELQNVIERAVITSVPGRLAFDLPASHAPAPMPGDAARDSDALTVLTYDQLRRRERDNIVAALRQSGGRIHGAQGAAELLGVNPTTLASKLKALGVKRSARD